MPVTLGAKPQHGFEEPLGLLSDCHRRIESFLGAMIRVLDRSGGNELNADERDALERSLRYFDTASPRHTKDEEESLFPRMRASGDPAAAALMARIDALQADHRRAELLHAEVARACYQWLNEGTLDIACRQRLARLLNELRDIYTHHIAIEDREVFPLAGRLLDAQQLTEVGQEMARRRGLQFHPTVRHQEHHP